MLFFFFFYFSFSPIVSAAEETCKVKLSLYHDTAKKAYLEGTGFLATVELQPSDSQMTPTFTLGPNTPNGSTDAIGSKTGKRVEFLVSTLKVGQYTLIATAYNTGIICESAAFSIVASPNASPTPTPDPTQSTPTPAPASSCYGIAYNQTPPDCINTCQNPLVSTTGGFITMQACQTALSAGAFVLPTPVIPTATTTPSPTPISPLPPCIKFIDINEPDPKKNDVTAIVTSDEIKKAQYANLQFRCEAYESALGPIETDPTKFIGRVFAILLSLSGVLVIYFIITAGYKLMMSQGDAEAVQGARETITSAIVGLLFIIFSMVILEVIGVSIFKIPGFNS